MSATDVALERAFRDEWAVVLAALTRRFGDLDVAEEATQQAFLVAAERWPAGGVPPNPGAWLMLTAQRKALDGLRRRRVRAGAVEALGTVLVTAMEPEEAIEAADAVGAPDPRPFHADDRLRLLFMCCHPALALDARVALTLRLVGGLGPSEIAGALFVEERTLQQRLVRAKRKLRVAAVPFTVPGPGELGARLDGVLTVLYLVFNEGWNASRGARLIRGELCQEAIRLARLLHALLPEDAEAHGLLALMLLHWARADARQDDAGRPVALAEQDRLRWDAAAIAEGTAELESALRRRTPGRFQVQAAISALHAAAPSYAEADWPQVAALYGELARHAPSPVVDVNRAVAVGMADGARAGLAILAGALGRAELASYAPLHAAHAELLERDGRPDLARRAWERAAAASANDLQRRALSLRAERAAVPS